MVGICGSSVEEALEKKKPGEEGGDCTTAVGEEEGEVPVVAPGSGTVKRGGDIGGSGGDICVEEGERFPSPADDELYKADVGERVRAVGAAFASDGEIEEQRCNSSLDVVRRPIECIKFACSGTPIRA